MGHERRRIAADVYGLSQMTVCDNDLCGVYQILNVKNGKSYVGKSVQIKGRWAIHKWTLSAGTHHSKYLQNSWKKYGSEAFEFRVIQCGRPEDLAKMEAYWGYYLREDGRNKPAYNGTDFDPEAMLCRRTDETKKKVSDWLVKNHPNRTPVIGTDLLNGAQKVYDAACDAKVDGFRPSLITACCIGYRDTHAGFSWRYATLDETRSAELCGQKIRAKKFRHRRKILAKSMESEDVQVFESVAEAVRSGFDKRCIYDCLRNEAAHHRGLIWSYVQVPQWIEPLQGWYDEGF